MNFICGKLLLLSYPRYFCILQIHFLKVPSWPASVGKQFLLPSSGYLSLSPTSLPYLINIYFNHYICPSYFSQGFHRNCLQICDISWVASMKFKPTQQPPTTQYMFLGIKYSLQFCHLLSMSLYIPTTMSQKVKLINGIVVYESVKAFSLSQSTAIGRVREKTV